MERIRQRINARRQEEKPKKLGEALLRYKAQIEAIHREHSTPQLKQMGVMTWSINLFLEIRQMGYAEGEIDALRFGNFIISPSGRTYSVDSEEGKRIIQMKQVYTVEFR